jgi:hypothetical protein
MANQPTSDWLRPGSRRGHLRRPGG